MSYGLEMCNSFASGRAALSVSSAVAELASCVTLHFNNIGQFTVRPVIFARLRVRVLLNSLSFICLSYKY
jgi:hypothetical protein